EQPSPAVTAGEGRSAVKQPAQAAGKKPAEEHPAGTEDAKQSAAAAVNLAPIATQLPPFLTLESIPRLGEKSRRPSTPEIANSRPGIADRRSDCRPSTLVFAVKRS
ncbi:hypothetical protein BHM03_00062877, partial [Ensete ventricosum]